ncbi:hypothetical protein EDB89DRAFT_2076259 [Lactarius sanguifluus]|nr:hypothetical protein EDB89DRAFT_2076259 [Lactarius sanguifluus]
MATSEKSRVARKPARPPATTRPSRGSVYTTVPFPDRAALARSLSYSTETRPRPPRTYLRHLAPREGLRAHSRRFTLPNPVHLSQLRTFWSHVDPLSKTFACHTCVFHPADGVTTNIFDAPLWDIHAAARNGDLEVVRLLLERGANAEAKVGDGMTSLHLASLNGNTETVRLLLDHGTNAHAEDNDGWTPLHHASSEGDTETVRLLLDRGASADAKDKEGRTPFQVASGETIHATLVSDPVEIFLLYMRLAVLKPADRSNMAQGQFLGPGPSSNQDVLLVYVEPKPPTKCRGGNAKGTGMPKAKEGLEGAIPSCSSTFTLWTKPLLGAIQGAVLWKQDWYTALLVLKSPSSVTHFDERGAPPAPQGRHDLFDYGKLSQAHVLKLGRSGTGLIALALSPFVRECTATDIPVLYCFCARTSSPPSPPPPLL